MKVWLPVDFYLGVSLSKRRLLEVPSVMFPETGKDRRALRLECCIVLNVCLIVDLKRLNAGKAIVQRLH